MPKQAADIQTDDQALLAVCGSESMVTQVKTLWEEMMEKKRMDVSGQGLTDDAVTRLLKGLHMCAWPSASSLERSRTERTPVDLRVAAYARGADPRLGRFLSHQMHMSLACCG